jgi:hypothetical protein
MGEISSETQDDFSLQYFSLLTSKYSVLLYYNNVNESFRNCIDFAIWRPICHKHAPKGIQREKHRWSLNGLKKRTHVDCNDFPTTVVGFSTKK